MPAAKNTSKHKKPTVFLSHSSNNRRELVALKRLLDERAGGSIDFFLSSDEESIEHGTIWPAEVRAALDRMALMLVFVSSHALKSGWTYFEAGYGLHKLDSANIFCLPDCEKDKLPSPFNLIQNKNLHSAKDLSQLINVINKKLDLRIKEEVTKNEYERVFKPIALGEVMPTQVDELVDRIQVTLMSPRNGLEYFSETCAEMGSGCGTGRPRRNEYLGDSEKWDHLCSAGVRIDVKDPHRQKSEYEEAEMSWLEEIDITDNIQKDGGIWIDEISEDRWFSPIRGEGSEFRTLAEIRERNERCRRKLKEIKAGQVLRDQAPRDCIISISSINLNLEMSIVDLWMRKAAINESICINVLFNKRVRVETSTEVVAAKIHGTSLSLISDGRLRWLNNTSVSLHHCSLRVDYHRVEGANELYSAVTLDAPSASSIAEFKIQDLVNTLMELDVLRVLPTKAK
ncbi:MAG: toll/interleukin-1 receptor domain-containing protein [Verrucomicrobiaceae bacterium]|nr:toll/interleukin-1 receptor domain-containing protein [Verrucomicrobiaceae bacterium]